MTPSLGFALCESEVRNGVVYRPAWLTRTLRCLGNLGRLLDLLTAYHAPSHRRDQQRGEYQCEEQWTPSTGWNTADEVHKALT